MSWFPVADFETIAAGILKKNGVVAWLFVQRPLNALRSSGDCDGREAPHIGMAVRPKRDSAFIGHVSCRLGQAKECRRLLISCRFVLHPTGNLRVMDKTQRGQQDIIKWSRNADIANSQINMIELSSHGSLSSSAL